MAKRKCSEVDCPLSARARGLCDKHYQRWRVAGGVTNPRSRPVDERFDEKWVLDPESGCHLWTGAHRELGYGVFWDGDRYIGAHVFAWRRKNGPPPAGKFMDHFHCDNPPCCNPDHVRPATPRQNTLRGDNPAAVNARKTHCKRGHKFTPENTRKVPGGRACRECERAWGREYQRKRRAKVKLALALFDEK